MVKLIRYVVARVRLAMLRREVRRLHARLTAWEHARRGAP